MDFGMFSFLVVYSNKCCGNLNSSSGDDEANRAFIRLMKSSLPVGKAIKMKYSLDQLFDMNKPGKYFVTVKSCELWGVSNQYRSSHIQRGDYRGGCCRRGQTVTIDKS